MNAEDCSCSLCELDDAGVELQHAWVRAGEGPEAFRRWLLATGRA